METFGTSQGEPAVTITITDCGIYTPLETPGAGYWLDKPDEEAYSGISPVFMVRPRVAVVAPTSAVMERFTKSMSAYAALTAVCVQDFETDDQVVKRITDLLSDFAVDVVVIAPACNNQCSSITLPPCWNDIPISKVLLEAKPVNALTTVWTQSWLTDASFALDGRAAASS